MQLEVFSNFLDLKNVIPCGGPNRCAVNGSVAG